MFPLSALADHIDVIEGQMKEGCSVQKYMAIVKDFNEKWAVNQGYEAEVLFPVHSNNLKSIYWLGRSANSAAFGAAFDKWNKDLTDPDSMASKLSARFAECSDNIGRRSYMTY
jgi:hypothetical protein